MSENNTIVLLKPILIARVPYEDATEDLTLETILTAKEENGKKYQEDRFALIFTFVVSIAFLLPAAIYDIVGVFRSSENFSRILFLPLDTRVKVFFYLMFQLGIILFISLILYSTFRYYLNQINYNTKNFKYNCINNQKLHLTLLNEIDSLDGLIIHRWKKKLFDFNDKTNSVKENQTKLVCEFYLSSAKDYWNSGFAVIPVFRDKLEMIAVPFLLMSTVMILIPYIELFKGKYGFIAILTLPFLFLLTIFVLSRIEKRTKKPLKHFGILLAYLAFVINNLMIILFIIFTNIFAFTLNTKKPKLVSSYYNISLFAFYFYSFLVIMRFVFSVNERRKQQNIFKEHYNKRIIKLEKHIAHSSDLNNCKNGKLSLFYDKQSTIENVSIFPFKFNKFILGFSTYIGFISLLSAVLTYILSIL